MKVETLYTNLSNVPVYNEPFSHTHVFVEIKSITTSLKTMHVKLVIRQEDRSLAFYELGPNGWFIYADRTEMTVNLVDAAIYGVMNDDVDKAVIGKCWNVYFKMKGIC